MTFRISYLALLCNSVCNNSLYIGISCSAMDNSTREWAKRKKTYLQMYRPTSIANRPLCNWSNARKRRNSAIDVELTVTSIAFHVQNNVLLRTSRETNSLASDGSNIRRKKKHHRWIYKEIMTPNVSATFRFARKNLQESEWRSESKIVNRSEKRRISADNS